ncbi:MAG: acetyl-CoA carboxylase biotin carboxyl carrier protein [Candidatus Omnitrophota bacterium]
MNIKEIKEVINLMNENNLAEIEIEKDGTRIKLRKVGTSNEVKIHGPVIRETEDLSIEQKQEIKTQEKSGKFIEIKAPMVGTFYRAPSPEAPTFVEIGQAVEAGQVICIIEAMKLMNEIKNEVRGRIAEILVENGEPVEFGQPIFLVEPL